MPSVVLSPALPSELLAYIVAHCVYPTTLVVCASSDEFVRVCVEEDEGEADDAGEGEGAGKGEGSRREDHGNDGNSDKKKDQHVRRHRWTSVSLLQVAVARHIRVAFVPTVAHLRAFLAAFEPATGPVPPPPPVASSSSRPPQDPPLAPAPPPPRPALLVYGFVALHHDTSEWSAQGVGASAAVLVEAAWRAGWDAVLVEGRKRRRTVATETAAAATHLLWDDAFPVQTLPVLSTVPRRQLQRAGYHLRTRPVRSVLGRWFRFRPGPWQGEAGEEGRETRKGEEAVPERPPAETLHENESPLPARPAARAYVKDSEGEDDEDEDEHDENNEPTQ